MTASIVLEKARYTLSDQREDRWSDQRLLNLLNDCLMELAVSTRLFNRTAFVEMLTGIPTYNVQNKILKLQRVEYLLKPLPFIPYEDMPLRYGSNWQEDWDTEPKAIVFDLQLPGHFRVYPVPEEGGKSIIDDDIYGIVKSIYYEDRELRFIIDDSEHFGEINELDLAKYLKVFYNSKPEFIEDGDSELPSVINDSYLSMMAHYVAGMAFRDDMDTQHRAMGAEELSLYQQKKSYLNSERMEAWTKKPRETKYRGMG